MLYRLDRYAEAMASGTGAARRHDAAAPTTMPGCNASRCSAPAAFASASSPTRVASTARRWRRRRPKAIRTTPRRCSTTWRWCEKAAGPLRRVVAHVDRVAGAAPPARRRRRRSALPQQPGRAPGRPRRLSERARQRPRQPGPVRAARPGRHARLRPRQPGRDGDEAGRARHRARPRRRARSSWRWRRATGRPRPGSASC